jgi:hypothetical protein
MQANQEDHVALLAVALQQHNSVVSSRSDAVVPAIAISMSCACL